MHARYKDLTESDSGSGEAQRRDELLNPRNGVRETRGGGDWRGLACDSG